MPTISPEVVEKKRREQRFYSLMEKVTPVPNEWWEQKRVSVSAAEELHSIECNSYEKLIDSWQEAMKWTDGLDCALSVMLASIASVPSVGDQLWVKIIGPASCGKSTLCEAVSVCEQYVLAKSTIRGFHSGFGDGTEDNSLIAKLSGKTLVTKDGDTLLQSPNLSQILAEARDVYDRVSRTHYRNRNSRDYTGISMTWLLCGTASLRSIDASELGERFLDCVIMHGIDNDMEDEILWRVAQRASNNMAIDSMAEGSSQDDPAMVLAKQLTGGYVQWLRENVISTIGQITFSSLAMRQCTRLGKFVAFMRARPSMHQEENSEREFAARLVSQHVRLAKTLAFVLNREEVDAEVMRRTRKVALDTARGQTLEIVDLLYAAKTEGYDPHRISVETAQRVQKTRTLLKFLQSIGVVEAFEPVSASGVRSKLRWRLTAVLYDLCKEVYEN